VARGRDALGRRSLLRVLAGAGGLMPAATLGGFTALTTVGATGCTRVERASTAPERAPASETSGARVTAAGAPAPGDVLFVIPRGTAEAQMRGEGGVVLPPLIELTAGGAIVVRNNDNAMHYFFSAPIAPGQTVRKDFPTPGQFGYQSVLSCSIAGIESVSVRVAPAGRR
jgi:hypothetical protein